MVLKRMQEKAKEMNLDYWFQVLTIMIVNLIIFLWATAHLHKDERCQEIPAMEITEQILEKGEGKQ